MSFDAPPRSGVYSADADIDVMLEAVEDLAQRR